MNTNNTSAGAGGLQDGYGSPTPEEEMPDSEKASNDPLLDSVTSTGKDPEQASVSEADLNKSSTHEPPD